jgi:hypothetical protein
MFLSVDPLNDIKEKMLQLKEELPHCEFIANYKPYVFEINCDG